MIHVLEFWWWVNSKMFSVEVLRIDDVETDFSVGIGIGIASLRVSKLNDITVEI
jgi:hypothetical protein